MGTIAVQYLDNARDISPKNVQKKLNTAFQSLPISKVIVGWNLPDGLLEACANECARFHADLYRWQPLLTSDAVFVPKPGWHTIGLNGEPVVCLDEPDSFTFACPNNDGARDLALTRIHELIDQNVYHGLFLDRIRFPSPTACPTQDLGCFCEYCRARAAKMGMDLEAVKQSILRVLRDPDKVFDFVRLLLRGEIQDRKDSDLAQLSAFLEFRCDSIDKLIEEAASVIHGAGIKVGLDCFSPALAYCVGQNLRTLALHADWIKIMSYGHTLGVAGLPFELCALADWLIQYLHADERKIYGFLSEMTRLLLPETRDELVRSGISSKGLAREVSFAGGGNGSRMFAGIELVDMDKFAVLNEKQIESDLRAFKTSGVEGLVLSWDLWRIPQERLDLVRRVWLDE